MKYNKKTLKDVIVKHKKVILRLDLNVPLENGIITDTKRIDASLKTLNYLIKNKSKVIILSHLGRIESLEDIKSGKKSLDIVAKKLQELLPKTKVFFERSNINKDLLKLINDDAKFPYGSIVLLENTRYNDIDKNGKLVKLESKNDEKLAKFWASLGDVFVNDAFGTCHREHASNAGIAKNIKTSCIGFLVENELKKLSKLIDTNKKPYISILGGAKVQDKIKMIEKIVKISDKLIIVGAMAHPFLYEQGYDMGGYVKNVNNEMFAKKLLKKYGDKIYLPIDVIATDNFKNPKIIKTCLLKDGISENLIPVDIGPKTIKNIEKILKNAKVIFWNGPSGIFEIDQFSKGTIGICKLISKRTKLKAYTVIGGGDSATAAKKFGFENNFSFISTGGGASISFIQGDSLLGLKNIENVKINKTSKKLLKNINGI